MPIFSFLIVSPSVIPPSCIFLQVVRVPWKMPAQQLGASRLILLKQFPTRISAQSAWVCFVNPSKQTAVIVSAVLVL